jgi:hypothetical protein
VTEAAELEQNSKKDVTEADEAEEDSIGTTAVGTSEPTDGSSAASSSASSTDSDSPDGGNSSDSRRRRRFLTNRPDLTSACAGGRLALNHARYMSGRLESVRSAVYVSVDVELTPK